MLDGNVLLRQKRDEVPEGTLSCPDRNLAVFHHCRRYEGLRLLPSVCEQIIIQQTLIMEMNECNIISDGSDWIYNSPDSTLSSFDDTISGNILGKKTVFYKFYYVEPFSKSGALFQDFDTCYLYVIRCKILNKYSIEEIIRKKMYDRRTLTKKDFHNHEYKYR